MNHGTRCLLLAFAWVLGCSAGVLAEQSALPGNWILNGGASGAPAAKVEGFSGEWPFTAEGKRRFDAYDFKTDDPALRCIAASWTRVWLNPNVVVQITQAQDHVRLRYEWMDIDRRIPLVDPASANPVRGHVEGHPALGRFMAWFDGDTLVIDTIDVAPGYVSTMEKWAGLPQSRTMRTVERLKVSGDLLTIEITHVDPAMYRKPLVVTITYPRTKFELMEYGCDPEDASIVAPK